MEESGYASGVMNLVLWAPPNKPTSLHTFPTRYWGRIHSLNTRPDRIGPGDASEGVIL